MGICGTVHHWQHRSILNGAAGWEKLQAGLDKQDATKYKRRFIGWKRIAILLLLLLSGFIIYETGVFKTHNENNENVVNSNSPTQNNSSANATTKPQNIDNKYRKADSNLDEAASDISTSVNPDNQKKNLFSPYTINNDSANNNPAENFITAEKNKIYDNCI